ncbi:MAG: A/G-specific adenine glycosylase [Candidatus Latescibacterota bacterium]|nr:MAG: A/G-specific adenine glycosylase [Candidatus Latescibacterota bacterium]
MRTKERLHFRRRLLEWYDVDRRDLPWRHAPDPYRTWVAEVMLQQTQVATVVPYYQRFVARYPDILTLARAPLEEILKSWENMGYYSRARNLHKAAGQLVSDFEGVIPNDYPSFKSLPGVGDYIAAAVMSIAFGHTIAVVDGNVKRVISRLFMVDAPVDHSSSAKTFKKRATELLDASRPGDFNQAMMELGATMCKPRNPLCHNCPVREHCLAQRNSRQTDFPVRRRKKKIPEYHIAVGVIYHGDRMLITRRKEDGLLGGLWEFPGGKVRDGEAPEDACKREIEEEVNLDVDVTGFITHVDHAYSHFKIGVDVFACRYRAGNVVLNGPIDHRWILVDQTGDYAFPAVNHKIFPHLKNNDKAK